MTLADTSPGDVVQIPLEFSWQPAYVAELTAAAAYVVPLRIVDDEIRTRSGDVKRVKRHGQKTAIALGTCVTICESLSDDQRRVIESIKRKERANGKART